MKRWRLDVADRSTGIECNVEVEANTEAEAIKLAGSENYLIARVQQIATSAPVIPYATPAPAPSTPLPPLTHRKGRYVFDELNMGWRSTIVTIAAVILLLLFIGAMRNRSTTVTTPAPAFTGQTYAPAPAAVPSSSAVARNLCALDQNGDPSEYDQLLDKVVARYGDNKVRVANAISYAQSQITGKGVSCTHLRVLLDLEELSRGEMSKTVNVNELRGPHAFGFAWIDSRGVLRSYKKTGRVSHHLPLLAMLRDARMLVGHLRYATHGSPADQINNHPHPADGGWIVHNGVIRNHEALIASNDLMPVSECDSEVLGLMIEDGKGEFLARTKRAINESEGPLAMLGLWNRPGRLIAARRGNPLHVASTSDGIYFATLADSLPGKAEAMRDGSAVEFGIERGKIVTQAAQLRPSRQYDLFQRSGPYRGG